MSPRLSETEILGKFKADLKCSETTKIGQDGKIAEWRSAYNGEPYGNEEAGKSAIVSRDIKKQSEWQHASIVEPFTSDPNIIKCNPITFEDTAAAKQNELLLNTQFTRKFDRFNFITKAIKLLDIEGTVIIQTGWDTEDQEVMKMVDVVYTDDFGNEYIEQEEVEVTVVTKNQPSATICRNRDVYIDPTCGDDTDNAQFIIHRFESNLSTLKKDGRYKNLDLVENGLTSGGIVSADYIENSNTFEFTDTPRQKLLVHEYWGNYDLDGDGIAEAIVCVWVNDTIIRLESNPYPDNKHPFIIVPFNSIPFEAYGEANAEIIGNNQKIKTAILRGFVDNLAASNNAQIAIRENSLSPLNKKNMYAGKHFEFKGSKNDIWQGGYNPIPNSAFDVLNLMSNEIDSITGVKSFSGGISGSSLGSTATGARGAMDATSVRRLNVVRNIAENMIKPIMRKWMSYNSVFLEDEEVVRITNTEFVPVRRDDLSGSIDIAIAVSTSEDDAAKVQELTFMLQTIGPNEDPVIRRNMQADILELMKRPESAKQLREYSPEVDPSVEREKELILRKMELENELLEAERDGIIARAAENQADSILKQAKAAKLNADTRNAHSNADLTDLKFLKEDEGIAHKEKLELENNKRLANLDSMSFQVLNEDKNIGVVT